VFLSHTIQTTTIEFESLLSAYNEDTECEKPVDTISIPDTPSVRLYQ